MKTLLVVFGLLGMTSGFGQDVVLKKLYDGIEDMRLVVKTSPEIYIDLSGEPPSKYAEETWFFRRAFNIEFGLCHGTDGANSFSNPIYVYKVVRGSFTKRGSNQKVFFAKDGCGKIRSAVSIMDGDKGIAFYNFNLEEPFYAAFSVNDINKNGLNEILFVAQSRAKSPQDEMLAVQLLEFPNANPVSLGSFFIGGPPRSDIWRPDYVVCTPKAPRELQKSFPSNIIYVQKGKVPQFFAESWEVNCDYLEKGVKARKVSGLIPIKPVPRAVPLTRSF
jgi:hypothetical protein